ncbi:MAG TPA: hypothetical protein PLI89_10350 [Chitinophagales bacterium]|nr:hypothetical protein [Chitinophagales bacterium]HQU40257.1 hypothetical protein [Chitinophagales bacterium]
MTEIKDKLTRFVEATAKDAEAYGSAKFSTCDHYNWDREIWTHRNDIINALKKRGYSVSVSTRWGVTDVTITKSMEL